METEVKDEIDKDQELDEKLIEDNSARLSDLALALCYYDIPLARAALEEALAEISRCDDGVCPHCQNAKANIEKAQS